MEGAPGTQGLQPLGVGGVLSAAFNLYRQQATNLWTIAALIVIPVQVLLAIIERISLSGGTTFASGGTIYTTDSTALPAFAIIVFGFVAAIIGTGALSKCLIDAYAGHATDWRHSLSFAAGRLGPLVWLAILSGVLVTIGLILLVIPGIYLVVCWALGVPVMMFEGIGGFAALRRSRELVQGYWWATFGALLVAIVCIVLLGIVVGLLLDGIANSGSVNVIIIVSAISRIVSSIITYPIVAAVTAVIYVDLRGRKEHVAPDQLTGAGEPPQPLASPTTPDIGLS